MKMRRKMFLPAASSSHSTSKVQQHYSHTHFANESC